MNRTVAIFFCLVYVAGTLSASGEDYSPDYKHLQPLEWQIGDWVTEYKSTTDSGPIKIGDIVTVHFSLHWSPKRSFMMNNSFSEVNGKRIASGLEVISWDSENTIVTHSYHGTWGTGHGVWTKVGDTAELQWTIKGEYGEFKGTSHIAKDTDCWKWQIKDQTQNDEPLPEMPVATFKQKTGAAAGDLWTAYQEATAGSWEGKGELLWDIPQYKAKIGDSFALKLTFKHDAVGNVLMGEQSFRINDHTEQLHVRLLAGWDPDAAQVRLYVFWDDGFVEELFLSSKQGDTFAGTYTTKAPGEPTKEAALCLEFTGPNSYAYRFLDGPHKGKVLSSWTRVNK